MAIWWWFQLQLAITCVRKRSFGARDRLQLGWSWLIFVRSSPMASWRTWLFSRACRRERIGQGWRVTL